MKILITGGLGHIGSYLIKRLVLNPIIKKIYILDNFSSKKYVNLVIRNLFTDFSIIGSHGMVCDWSLFRPPLDCQSSIEARLLK